MAVPAVQYAPSSTDTPTPIQQSSFQKYVTTLQNLPGGQTPLGFQYDALSSAEIHNHEQRETSQHLVSPPPPQQQTELPHYNQNQQQIQQTWQKLLREQQQQRNWSPVPQPTKSLPPTYNKHKKDTFSGPSHSLNFEDQSSEQLDLRTEGPFRPNTSPYGDSESFVGVVYKDNIREVSDLYTDLPSTADPSFNDQLGSNDYLRPQAAPPTRQPARQKANIPDKNLTEKPERNTRRPHNRKPVSYPQTTSRHNFAVESDGNQKHVVRTPDVAPHSDTTSIPHGKYESLKLPAQTKNGKLHGSDSQEDVYERKPEDYDKKVSYDEDETLEEKNPGSRKPEPERESQTNSDFRYRNRGNTHTETKTGRKRPQYNTEQSNRNIPQNRNRQPVRQETSEQTYDGDLPQTEESASSDQPDSYDTETHESDGSALSDKDQAETIPHLETTTEDRFPAPPPEFYEEFNKFKHITNPFASFDFDFDAYLDKLRGNPKPASEQESSKVQITNTEPPEVSNYDTEGDNINSTTYQNSESTTTTVKPNVQQVDHTEPSGQRTSQGLTKEYIKEYYPPPPRNAKNVYNEEIGAHNEEDEIQKHNQQGRPADTDTETVKGSAYQSEHITSTTHAPQLEIATVNHHIKPHPLTVPFYPGEDGNFYANPVHIQSQQPETTLAGRTQDTVLPTVTGNRYSVQEENFDTIQSTERIPHTTSTSKSYLQSHRNSNANNHKSYESTVTTPFPAGRDNVNPLHPVHVVVTTPSRGSKPPRRGPIRNMPQNSKHIYASQTMETNKANDGSRKNAYYDSAYHQQRVTKPRVRVKAPHTTPASSLPHPFTATAFSSNRYQYQGAQKTSTEHTTPRPLANPASSLTQSDTNPKKTGHSYIHISGEENDTIRPLKILQNERTPQSHKTLSTGIYNSPILSPTTEFLSTSSTTRYNDPKTYNSWQSTVPYQQEVSNFELTTPTHSKHKVTDDNSESRFNSESDLTTPSLPEYTTVTLINMHDIPSENTPITYSGVQTSTRPSNELLDSIYDIAKTMFKPQYDTASDPSSESANQNPFTKLSLFHPNVTTTTISSITHLKPGHQRPLNQIPRGPGIMNHVNKYTTSGADHTTHETYTTRHRPSNDHPSLPVRHRTHRPLTKSLQSSAANVITTTTSPSSDIHTTLIYPSPTHSQLPVMPRRLRRPPKVRFDVTSTEAYPDNDKSESIERPLQHNVNRLNKIPLGSTMTAAPHRVEPSVTPVTYAQQQAVQVPANANVYNNSQRYSPTQYDPYYNIYDEDVEIYRDVDYTQFPSNQGSRQTNANNQQPQYRGQSPYKQPPQGLTQQGQTNAAYAQPSHNTQQDVYVQNIDPQEYNENYNTAADDQTQYKQQSGVRQPNKSSSRGSNTGRTRGDPSYTTASGAEPNVNRGTPASVSRSRPTLKPSTAIVSKAQEFVDIYRYPPRRPDPVYPTPQVDKTAAKCRKDVCLLPDCYCGGKDIPGNLPGEEIPQIVLLTFDDAINDLNKGLYQDIFEKGRTNPNGCPITATFYVSHEWTDYSQVQNLYAEGHEMASHSISHSFGEQFSQKKWTREIAGQQEILAAYGGVRMEDIRGMRAPFLAIGGNKMFKMLYDSNFTYDSSMPVYENRPPSWPYTLDYKIFHDCMIPPCPTRSYPGVWEVPMVMWQDLNGGRCSMGDACSNPPTADGVYKMLIKNFERHYTTNRAPFGLFYHAAWFTQPHHKEGFIAFLDTIVNMQDVWLVTNWQAIQWVRDPTPLSRINSFPPFQCNYPERPRRCNNPKVCNLWHKSGVRYMRTCQPCPDVYPWTGKTGVRNSRVDNEIIEES
ncbi:hypothetical protein B7P43_G07308 [Cryptotermes secundus]|uniref:NodB homology domain-containing protein n=2 Tax=Cryptotermes secundus TaxID=105785 RepID=A0A2J7PSK7_9NEOP|nr:hypothetical protein B7P43_G07308 [Cryptotermes secundus]